MKVIYVAILLTCFFSCDHKKSEDEIAKSSSTESTISNISTDTIGHVGSQMEAQRMHLIMDSLFNLEIVKSANSWIDSISDGERSISLLPDSAADNNDELFVLAGDNRAQRFQPYFHFYINMKTLKIRIYDAVADDTIGIENYKNPYK